jgi:phosphopantothenoylcysteine decarboxylase/phosphopantothenate--cysteine ligase
VARVLITSGPTREPLDPIRFLSNASTGRMGAALAAAALRRGHEVDLVAGPSEAPPPAGVNRVAVTTALEMLAACERLHPACDAVIGAAAVSDYRPRRRLEEKRPRSDGPWTLELEPNPDILEELGRRKGGRIHAGFALETLPAPAALRRAQEKLLRKNLDWIVLNSVQAIGSDSGTFILIPRQGPEIRLGALSKEALAAILIERMLPEKRGESAQPLPPPGR